MKKKSKNVKFLAKQKSKKNGNRSLIFKLKKERKENSRKLVWHYLNEMRKNSRLMIDEFAKLENL